MLAYLLLTALYGIFLGLFTLVNHSPWTAWWFVIAAFALGAMAGVDFRKVRHRPQGQRRSDSERRARLKVSTLSWFGLMLMLFAYAFGTKVYPWVKPHYGGAAVPVGYVTLKRDAPTELSPALQGQSLPLFDIDEKFLYVVTCRDPSRTGRPEVLMVPLEFLASAGIATPDALLGVPTYIDQHRCGPRVDTKNGTP